MALCRKGLISSLLSTTSQICSIEFRSGDTLDQALYFQIFLINLYDHCTVSLPSFLRPGAVFSCIIWCSIWLCHSVTTTFVFIWTQHTQNYLSSFLPCMFVNLYLAVLSCFAKVIFIPGFFRVDFYTDCFLIKESRNAWITYRSKLNIQGWRQGFLFLLLWFWDSFP